MTDGEVENVVMAFERAYADAIRNKDAGRVAALVADDVLVMSEWGDVMRGRRQVEEQLRRAFARMAGRLELEIRPRHWRLVSPGVIVSQGVVEKGTWGPGADRLAYTRVLVREGGEWRMAAAQVAEPERGPAGRRRLTRNLTSGCTGRGAHMFVGSSIGLAPRR
jgi:uncharacterized protein (TIGR02246 family)